MKKILENHVEGVEQNPAAFSSTSAVARCCLNAAVMLEVADSGEIRSRESLATIRKCNEGQAALLREAACLADDMLAALIHARKQLEEYEEARTGETFNDLMINAAIAKAEGR